MNVIFPSAVQTTHGAPIYLFAEISFISAAFFYREILNITSLDTQILLRDEETDVIIPIL